MAAASYGYVIVPPLFLFHLTLGLFGNWTTNMTRSPFSSGYCHCGEGGEERSLCLRAPTSFEISFPSDGIERRLLGRAVSWLFERGPPLWKIKGLKWSFIRVYLWIFKGWNESFLSVNKIHFNLHKHSSLRNSSLLLWFIIVTENQIILNIFFNRIVYFLMPNRYRSIFKKTKTSYNNF